MLDANGVSHHIKKNQLRLARFYLIHFAFVLDPCTMALVDETCRLA